MLEFSKRNNIVKCEFLSEGKMTNELRQQLWQYYCKNEEECEEGINLSGINTTVSEEILSCLGIDREVVECGVHGVSAHKKNIQKLKKHICESSEWFLVYDFIEYYCEIVNSDKIDEDINYILKRNLSIYRLVNKKLIPIMDIKQIEEIENALQLCDNSSKFIEAAVKEYSNKTKCDYNKIVTSSISAVEASVVKLIDGKKDTLGQARTYYEKNCNSKIDGNLLDAIKKLYYFSCNAGLRHGGIDYYNATDDEARLYLIVCSAVTNYIESICGEKK